MGPADQGQRQSIESFKRDQREEPCLRCCRSSSRGLRIAAVARSRNCRGRDTRCSRQAVRGGERLTRSEENLTPVVKTMVGDRVPQDQCFVVSISKVTSHDSSGREPNANEVQVNLSCYARPADRVTPGFSRGNSAPDAVAVRDAHDEATQNGNGAQTAKNGARRTPRRTTRTGGHFRIATPLRSEATSRFRVTTVALRRRLW